MARVPLIASRAAGLARLAAFVPKAGRDYARDRNTDPGPGETTGVSGLSPYIRHRLVTEQETVAAVLASHSASAAEKFIQEVCWRTYWKGWLEQRPAVWTHYLDDLAEARAAIRDDPALAGDIAAAEAGETGLPCFDAWARELVETNTLHNHTRMWFASLWIFTLRLPWVLGADFFMRHLSDGDPASNTLSWRWVGGLHTKGKTYLARPDNIATYTLGRFRPSPRDVAATAIPLEDPHEAPRTPIRTVHAPRSGARMCLLITEEDTTPEHWPLHGLDVAAITVARLRDVGPYAAPVRTFKAAALDDAAQRASSHWPNAPVWDVPNHARLLDVTRDTSVEAIVTPHLPIGYTANEIDTWRDALADAGRPLCEVRHAWDAHFWPHAKAGFFQLKDRIPTVLRKLDLAG
jgi:hypothetical protein